MNPVSLRRELSSAGDLHKLLNAFLALDRTVVEFYMQIYRTRPDHQFAILMQNQCLHGIVKERVPLLLYGNGLRNKSRHFR